MSLEDDSHLNAIRVDKSSNHKPRICLNILASDRQKCNGHPVVRSQSSRAALLRQPDGRPPASACSVTSGAEVEHFPLPDKYVEYRSGNCRISRWILSIVFLVTTAISLWLLHIYGWIAIGGEGVESKMCLKPACIKTAARLLSRLDPSVDPCTDFYKFTCGKFLVSGNMPDDSHHLSTLHEMQDDIYLSIRRIIEEERLQGDADEQEGRNGTSDSIRKAQQLYASCMNPAFEDSNYAGLGDHPLHRFVSARGEIGAWPLLQAEHWLEEKVSLERLIATLAAYQVHSFFDLYLSPDEKNTSTLSVQIYKGDSLIDKEWFDANRSDNGHKHGRYIRAYRNLIEESVLLLSRGQHHLLREVDDIINFEARFAKVAGSSCSDQDALTKIRRIVLDVPNGNRTLDDSDGNEQRYTLADIQEQFPSLNWTVIVDGLLESVGLDHIQRSRIVTDDMVLSLQCQAFLSDIVELLRSTPKRTVVNYLVWRFLFKMMPYIGTRFHRLMLDFKTSVPNLNDERLYVARWKHCVHLVNEGMGLTLAHLYITREAPLWSISKIQELIQEIKQVFGQNIAQQDWIEEDMKQRLLEKLKSMGSKIGFPSRVFNAEEMDREYEDLVIADEHILFNVARLRKHELWREVKKIFQPEPLKEKDWLVQPLVVNAFHNTGSNEIIFPLGILREPLYHPDYPKYVLYGNLGVVIGHELIHGFDENGRRYDHLGNLTHWWSETLLREFRQRADCFVQQYSSYPIDMIGKNVDGNVTLGENICDSAGMAHAWSAYKNTAERQEDLDLPGVPYTHDQLFFITYGQIWCEVLTTEGFEKYAKEVHSPGKYRAIGVLQNSEVFSNVFNCPLGSPMNPHTKCKLWS